MTTPNENLDPNTSVPQEDATESEAAGRARKSDPTSVPQDQPDATTSVPQDNT